MDSRTLQAFRDEMRKMAAESEPVKEGRKPAKDDWEVAHRAQLGMIGGMLAAYGTHLALMKGGSQPSTPTAMLDRINRIAGEMKIPKPFLAMMPKGKEPGGWSPSFASKGLVEGTKEKLENIVNIPLNSRDQVIAHELGHMKSHMQSSTVLGPRLHAISEALQGASRTVSRFSAVPTIAMAATSEDMSYMPGIIQAIISSPMVADEIAASARATAHLIRQHGAGKGVLKSLPLVPALATYLSIAGTPMLVTYLRRKAAEKEATKAKEVKEKTSEVDENGLNFFERHPKKILGGAALAAGGGLLLLKGKKVPAVKVSVRPPAATKPAPLAKRKPRPEWDQVVVGPDRKMPVESFRRDPKAPVQRHKKGRHEELLDKSQMERDLQKEVVRATEFANKQAMVDSAATLAYSSR